MTARDPERGVCPGGGLNRVILDCVADGVFTVDRDFRVTSMNRAAEVVTGVHRDEARGALCREVFRADICTDRCALRETLETGRPVVNRAVHIVRPDGTRVPISVSAAVLRDDAGEVIGGVDTFRDLTLVEELRRELTGKASFHDIISRNPEVQELFRLLPEIARAGSTVLLEGPSGSGKELFARAVVRSVVRGIPPGEAEGGPAAEAIRILARGVAGILDEGRVVA